MSNDFFQQSFTPIRQNSSLSGIQDRRNNKINGGNPMVPPPPPPPRRPSSSSVPAEPSLPSTNHKSQFLTSMNKQSDLQNANMMPAVKKTDSGNALSSFPNNGNVNGYGRVGNASGTMKRPTGNYYGIATANAGSTGTTGNINRGGGETTSSNNAMVKDTDSDADDWFTPSVPARPYGNENIAPSDYSSMNHETSAGLPVTNSSMPMSMQSQSSLNAYPQRSDSMTELYSGSIMSGPMSNSNTSVPASFTNSTVGIGSSSSGGNPTNQFQDEPPLLEELGINLSHIQTKSLAVILPVRYAKSVIDTSIMEDNDMAGPLAFGLLLATELLLAGKIHFGYIYGFGMFGCFATTLVLNLMSPSDSISIWTVVSILGYSLLPVNFLAAINVFYRIKYMGSIGVILAAVTISWCTISSTRLIERGCGMRDQRYLIGYPNALLYSAFVMLTIF